MTKKNRHQRLSKTEIRQQLVAIARLRRRDLSVAEACKRAGVPVPTYYFRAKSFPALAVGGRRAGRSLKAPHRQAIDGRTLAALRRSKRKHAALAARLREDLLTMRRVQRQLLRTVRALG